MPEFTFDICGKDEAEMPDEVRAAVLHVLDSPSTTVSRVLADGRDYVVYLVETDNPDLFPLLGMISTMYPSGGRP